MVRPRPTTQEQQLRSPLTVKSKRSLIHLRQKASQETKTRAKRARCLRPQSFQNLQKLHQSQCSQGLRRAQERKRCVLHSLLLQMRLLQQLWRLNRKCGQKEMRQALRQTQKRKQGQGQELHYLQQQPQTRGRRQRRVQSCKC